MIDLAQFHEMFFDECEESLENARNVLLDYGADGMPNALQQLQRCVHSIKGGAKTFGFDQVAELAASLEQVLERVAGATGTADPDLMALCRSAFSVLRASLVALRRGQPLAEDEIARMRVELDRIGTPLPRGDGGRPVVCIEHTIRRNHVVFRPARSLISAALVMDDMLQALGELGQVVVRRRPASDMGDGVWQLDIASHHPVTALREILGRVADPETLQIRSDDPEPFAEADEGRIPSASPRVERAIDPPPLRSPAAGPAERRTAAREAWPRDADRTASDTCGPQDHLVFVVGGQRFAVRAECIASVRACGEVQRMAGLPDGVKGLAVLDGRFAPVIDLRRWLRPVVEGAARFVPQLVLNHESGPVSLLVDEVEDVVAIDVADIQRPHTLLSAHDGLAPVGLLMRQHGLLPIVDLVALVEAVGVGRPLPAAVR
ncbi:chemotaxis protein CheW [Rhodocyclaceae bacterium SMB388]